MKLKVVERWDYEPEEFFFNPDGYKRYPRSYKPDFRVKFLSNPNKKVMSMLKDIGFEHTTCGLELYWEVKGQETGADRSKWKFFRKQTPYELEIIKRDKLRKVQNNFKKLIPEWESNIY